MQSSKLPARPIAISACIHHDDHHTQDTGHVVAPPQPTPPATTGRCKAAFLECAQQLDNMRGHLSRQSSADAEAAGAAALEVEQQPEPDLSHLPSYARPTR